MPRRGWRAVTVREKLYGELRRIAVERGFSSLSDAVAHLVELEKIIMDMKTRASLSRDCKRGVYIDYGKICRLLEISVKLANRYPWDEYSREIYLLWEELSDRCPTS